MKTYRILKITNTCRSTNKKTYYVLEKKGWFGWKRLTQKWVESCYYNAWSYFFKDLSFSFKTVQETKNYFKRKIYIDEINFTTEEVVESTTTNF